MSVLGKIRSYFSGAPNASAARTKAYDAALQNRLTSDWCGVSRLSADAELQGKIPIIRSRSREGEQNDPYLENYFFLHENNVIGSDGFTLQMKVKKADGRTATGNTEQLDDPINRAIERAWKTFGNRKNFLVTRNLDSVSAWKLILRTMLRDGDCLIRKVRGYPLNPFRFALQLFESDYLDDSYIDFRGVPCQCPQQFDLPLCQSGLHEVRMGVELQGDWKFPVAYWLLAQHPGDAFYGGIISPRRLRVPVDEIIHPFVFKRIEQSRGVPAMVAGMLRLQMLGGYDEAALVSARAAAQKMGFLEKEIPDSVADQYAEQWAEGQASINSAPGEIEELPMGVKFKEWNPTNPNDAYAPFVKTQLRGAACAGGVSYTSLANDIESVNFSSIRAGLLEEREGYKGKQNSFIKNIVREVFEAWLPMAILSGQLDVPISRLEEYTAEDVAVFKGRRWPWVDPQKDVRANVEALAAKIVTRSEIISDRGGDFEEMANEYSYEQDYLRKLGIDPAPTDKVSEQLIDPNVGDNTDEGDAANSDSRPAGPAAPPAKKPVAKSLPPAASPQTINVHVDAPPPAVVDPQVINLHVDTKTGPVTKTFEIDRGNGVVLKGKLTEHADTPSLPTA